jgi:hypothetical protein
MATSSPAVPDMQVVSEPAPATVTDVAKPAQPERIAPDMRPCTKVFKGSEDQDELLSQFCDQPDREITDYAAIERQVPQPPGNWE